MNNQTMKSIQRLSISLKNIIVLKWREQNDMDRNLIIRSLEFIINDTSNDYILELKNTFPEGRVNFQHINRILNELQNLQNQNQEVALEVNRWIKNAALGAYNKIQDEIMTNSTNYAPIIIGTIITVLGAAFIINKRRR